MVHTTQNISIAFNVNVVVNSQSKHELDFLMEMQL